MPLALPSRRRGLTGLAALTIVVVGFGCSNPSPSNEGPAATVAEATTTAPAEPAPPPPPKPFEPAHAGCDAIPVFANGGPFGSVCAEDAATSGLTVVDLSDSWTPRIFAPDATTHDAPEYREKYLALANNSGADLGLYGIAPSMTVVAKRLVDEKRIACEAGYDLAVIGELRKAHEGAADAKAATALTKAPAAKPAMTAIQSELVCAGFMKKTAVGGALTSTTLNALDAFRRRHMIIGTGLDGDTLDALALGGDELELRSLLRVLRERVADASGLIEDGSASETHALVADRDLDLSRFAPAAREALEGGAPDLVDQATDVAARALGWTSPDAARAFLASRGDAGVRDLRVAVALPAPPSYHSTAMDLRVEIDRGDVFYEMPGAAAAARKKLGSVRGPSFVVYAKDGDHDVPLMRWATTIGGWKKERTEEGELALKYKESDVGDRVWKQLIAAPAWMPPDSTPETDLLRETKDGSFALKQSLIQPGFQNAYGLVMLIHHEPVERNGETVWLDRGIRTHGSVDYRSIQRGESHGCHRLYNQLALRLSGFLLEHRSTVRKGKMRAGYHRTLEWNEQTVEVDVPDRGYLYELDPPVPVKVLEGRIAGERQKPVSSLVPIAPPPENKG